MTDSAEGEVLSPERFRSYLLLLAKLRLDRRLRGKVDASDLVQQTMLRAHQARGSFRGQTMGEQAVWLRQILARTMADAVRDLCRAKRDVTLERSLEAALDESSARLGAWIAAEGSSPSQQAMRNERAVILAEGLARLPAAQRDALILKHCEGWTIKQIGEHLGRTPASVASLLRRGLAALREYMPPE